MKRIITYMLTSLIFLISCSEKKIPNNEMSKIIADLYLLDGYISTDINSIRTADSTAFYEVIIKKHGYSKEEFLYSIGKLVERPGKLKLVYQKAKDILAKEQLLIDKELMAVPENSVSAEIMKIIYDIDQGIEVERYKRALRWLTYPDHFIHWKATYSAERLKKYEEPCLGIWWANNIPPKEKPFYDYENNKRSNFIPN
jgi:hypothetical protein